MISIQIRTVDHKSQRYDTCGDWWWENETLQVRISLLGNEKYEFLVTVHELIEAFLCKVQGVSEEAVTQFDLSFEGNDEPGDDRKAPYHRQHRWATRFERALAWVLGVDWQEYDDTINRLEY